MRMKKIGRMNLIFDFSISNLGYMAIFMKIWEKKLTHFLRHFWLIRAKMKVQMKKNWENKFDLWILRIKIRFYGNFHENLWKKRLTHFLGHFWLIVAKMKMKMKIWKKKLDFWILDIKIRLCGSFHENLWKNFWPIFWDIFD